MDNDIKLSHTLKIKSWHEIKNDHEIKVLTEYDGISKQVREFYINTQEKLIQEGLQKLGWTPPENNPYKEAWENLKFLYERLLLTNNLVQTTKEVLQHIKNCEQKHGISDKENK